MAFILSSTTLLVTLAFIFLQSSTVSSDDNPMPAEKHLPPKALDVCKETKTAVCPKGSGDKEPVCEGVAKAAGGTDPKCDEDNGCSFMLKMKINNVDEEKLVYVSHGEKIKSALPDSTTYKKCDNGLIMYSLYVVKV